MPKRNERRLTKPKILFSTEDRKMEVHDILSLFPRPETAIRIVRGFNHRDSRGTLHSQERGHFYRKSRTIAIDESLNGADFRGMMFHEIGHAFIDVSKESMSVLERKELFGERVAHFISRYVLTNFAKIEKAAEEASLPTSYIDVLYLKYTKHTEHSKEFVNLLASYIEELLCDLFALYCATRFNRLSPALRRRFEELMQGLNIPKPCIGSSLS